MQVYWIIVWNKEFALIFGIGVSAGAANISSYMANQRGRNFVFYTDYFQREQYMGVKNLIHTGSYIGLDYIYSSLSDHEGIIL